MVYVPSVWVKHNENKKKVTLILEKLDSDIKDDDPFTEEDAIKELEQIDEPTVIEKLKSGTFNFGA
ncbi:hypothetical protein [Clostridium beijerinckii]|uniref:hypothetical protein n=1 Tax=Clostridium beijerinckii TaxID=1520 RepID=UPI0003D34E72|nr:hypothetical protein [Clostridium beijerinckii]ALB46225.1 hypothetical protein X276_13760 [Clostridium beijerinckii NRRL B-598]